MCGGMVDGSCEFFSKTEHRSRKERRCEECYTFIGKGERYLRCAGKWDGYFSTYDLCLKCDRVVAAYFAAERAVGHHESAYGLGELRGMIVECVREEPHFLVAFRAAWKGLPVPKAPPPPDMRSYSSVHV